LDKQTNPKGRLLRYLRWRDLIVAVLGVALGLWINTHYFKLPTDYQKWQARPKLDPRAHELYKQDSSRGINPCLFIVPYGAVGQPVVSGSIGECLLLVPDGKELDLIEVALAGFVLPIKTDLFVEDSFPLAFTRTYFPKDDWSTRNRIFLPHVYDPYLTGNRYPYTYLDWLLPDRQSIHYPRISPGTGFADAVYENASPGPVFAGSRVAWNGWGWDLALEDGITYLSPEAYNATRPQQGSLVGIFDREGNEVRLSRNRLGDLTEVKSPAGRWIRFYYDAGYLVRAADSSGKKVEYEYDSNDRLELVRHSTGQTEKYRYDSSNRIVSVEDSPGGTNVEIKYGSNRMVEQITGTGGTFRFQYTRDKLPNSGHVDILDSQGDATRIKVQGSERGLFFTVEKVGRVPSRH
jgi:YD repeat-containing protein